MFGVSKINRLKMTVNMSINAVLLNILFIKES